MAIGKTTKFDDLNIQNADQFFTQVMEGKIVCPEPILWDAFWKKYIKPTEAKTLMPLILSSWWHATDEEKNERFIAQLNAMAYQDKKSEIFEFFRTFDTRNEWRAINS